MEEMSPLGVVVAGSCEVEFRKLCQAPKGKVGAVLAYEDKAGRQVNCCKACADYKFQIGDWIIPGGSLNSFQRYLKEFVATDNKMLVARQFMGERWKIILTESKGTMLNDYVVVITHLGNLGFQKVAMSKELHSLSPEVVSVRAAYNEIELEKTGEAPLVATEKSG